jgi:hypothetical protein
MNAANETNFERYPESTPVVQQRRVSWGAVFGGLSVAVVVQLALSLLGIGLGASTIDPLQEQDPAQGLGIGSMIWMMLSGLISLFCGAWVAGRLAYGSRKSEGSLHGVLMWSVATLVTVFLLVTTAGAIIGGVGALIGGALGLGQQANTGQDSTQAVTDKVKSAFPEVGSLLPGGSSPAGQLGQFAKNDPQLAAAIARMESRGGASAAPAERDEVVKILSERHAQDQAAATALVTQWDQQFQQAKAMGEQKAREVGEGAAKTVSTTALLAFAALVLGALVSAWGGNVGARYWARFISRTAVPA